MPKVRNPRDDHVARLIEQRRRETPDIPLDGMEILARARRLDLLSRPAIEAVFKKHGIDAGEFDVLATLQRAGPPYTRRPTELYEALMISSGGLTDRLARLEKRDLVERTSSPSDGRSLLVKLTAKGLALIDKAFQEDMTVELELLTPLNQHERETLATLLAKLLRGIEENRAPDK